MTIRSNTCPKCQGSMNQGYVLSETQGWRRVSTWIAGAPEKSVWGGLKLGGRQQLPVQTFRCNRCGFLENYAPG